MESSSDQKSDQSLQHSRVYQVLACKHMTTSIVAFVCVNLFFFFYIALGNSLINMTCKTLLIIIIYKSVVAVMHKKEQKDSDDYDYQVVSEEGVKELYIVVYVVLNNAVQYLRDIIQLKDHKRSLMVNIYIYISDSIITHI